MPAAGGGGSLPTTPGGYAPSEFGGGGHPGLGTVPGRRRMSENLAQREGSDFDETEPLGSLTSTRQVAILRYFSFFSLCTGFVSLLFIYGPKFLLGWG